MKLDPSTRLVIVAVLAFAIGWLASAAGLGLAPLRYAETVSGTVAVISKDGAKLCLEPDGGGAQRCGVLVSPPGATEPSVGDHLSIVVGWLRISDQLEQEIFVLAAPPPVGG